MCMMTYDLKNHYKTYFSDDNWTPTPTKKERDCKYYEMKIS
jgi:hypothetical protein